ncbi:hypothetical protein DCAR_0830588 [Daucus carota subsp. sativus]|uniref:Uncharacterized protein n=1 Tax=Daucus carota subsp. sativus TaxID=79200 RepID=A0A175YJE9_DAUCS|nr:hypothetical protein DCAR_0830588 [Daucus carota subsp. sativus]
MELGYGWKYASSLGVLCCTQEKYKKMARSPGGSEEKKGNYREAWTFGAVDPTAAQQLYFRSCRVYAGSFIKVVDRLRKLQKKG